MYHHSPHNTIMSHCFLFATIGSTVVNNERWQNVPSQNNPLLHIIEIIVIILS